VAAVAALAVWLRRPAARVSAHVAGRSFELDDARLSERPARGRRRMFVGVLRHAGLRSGGPLPVAPDDGPGRCVGRRPVTVTVELRIRAPGEREVTLSRRVHLSVAFC
jgi:hypothetical protein